MRGWHWFVLGATQVIWCIATITHQTFGSYPSKFLLASSTIGSVQQELAWTTHWWVGQVHGCSRAQPVQVQVSLHGVQSMQERC